MRKTLPTMIATLAIIVTPTNAFASPSITPARVSPTQAPAGHASEAHGRVPFTSAKVEKSENRWMVSWQASGVRRVDVFAGDSPDDTSTYVGSGRGTASLTVTDPTGVAHPYFTLVPDHGRSLLVADRKLPFEGVPNFRDVGGYRATDGKWVRMGLLYRSSVLTLTPSDLATVQNDLDIRHVYDLRSPAEISATPDVIPSNVSYVDYNVIAALSTSTPPQPVPPTNLTEDAAYLDWGYTLQMTAAPARQNWHDLFTSLAVASGPSIIHCNGGQDRTGLATALLLSILDVPWTTVQSDYELTFKYLAGSELQAASFASMPPAQRQLAEYTQSHPEWMVQRLDAAFAAIHQQYGSIQNYAINGLGLTPSTLMKLRAKYLVGPGTGKPAA